MRIHLLDVGQAKYGDCILITRGNRRILIDGAHPGDSARVRSQLKTLLGRNPPFGIDLLVVTHCHSDHIGCLPALIGSGDLKVKKALVADEKLGWGRSEGGDGPIDSKRLSDQGRRLVAALQEEDYSDLPDADLEQFLQDAASLEEQYTEMLNRLGTSVVRYGRDSVAKIKRVEADFADFGLQLLGPTMDHLVQCAEAISLGTDALGDAVMADGVDGVDAADSVDAYRRLRKRFVADAGFASDQPGVGAAKNNQSLVLKVAADGWSALLAGDMQFAKPEVTGLNALMTALRRKVADAGPYDFIKFPHHSSYNAVDVSILDEWSRTKLFGHTGGAHDPGHPDEGVLDLLKVRQLREQFTFARTDHNGIVTIEKSGDRVKMSVSRGEFNDFDANRVGDLSALAEKKAGGTAAPVPQSAFHPRGEDGGTVEVITRVPHRATKVTVTIEVEPREVERNNPGSPGPSPDPETQPAPRPSAGRFRLGGGRSLPNLLFVTCRPRLELNIGQTEAAQVMDAIGGSSSVQLVDLPPSVTTAEQAAEIVRGKLHEGIAGVVVLGGFDVVPSERLDVLDSESRRRVENAGMGGNDADDFIVWSDEIYGDSDGDSIPELPVSRVPDGRRADVVRAALQAEPLTVGRRFGVRNVKRPFAIDVFPRLPGAGGELLVSETLSPDEIPPGAAVGAVYYMLHGSARDGTRFWGETAGGTAYEAVAIENVPASTPGCVVFTGCCWGALAMSPPASRARPETPLRPRGPEASLAMAYLKAGAIGFVGCTGSHYSPTIPPYEYFGKPMHQAFWASIARGSMPAAALFQAKQEYARSMPHGTTDPFSQAVELKILRQYTCLGLGW